MLLASAEYPPQNKSAWSNSGSGFPFSFPWKHKGNKCLDVFFTWKLDPDFHFPFPRIEEITYFDFFSPKKTENWNCAPKSNRWVITEKISACLLGQEILDSFQDTEFWYAEQGSMSSNSSRSGSFRRVVHHKEEKWWLPVPCVPSEGLSESSRKYLQQKRDCAYQIHKAAMAINSSVLDEMDIPQSFLASLPKVSFQPQWRN